MSSVKYRPEIDGLRAIAILSVLFFHAQFSIGNINLFAGGFIGVDIFFVISGYLIAKILFFELNDSKFEFLKFYERRARRILPALFFIILSTIPLSYLYLLPKAMKEYSISLLATLLFSSNF